MPVALSEMNGSEAALELLGDEGERLVPADGPWLGTLEAWLELPRRVPADPTISSAAA
jgi:hypothetical protein